MYKLKESILSYEEVIKKLKEIEIKSNGKIKKISNCPKTYFGYEIPHYIIGNGNNHIVLVAGTHGNEIISVDFMLKVMEDIANNNGYFKNINFNDITLHILPLNNPEGYIIVTSAIKTKIKDDMSDEKIEEFCFKYYQNFRTDNIISKEEIKNNVPIEKRSIKKHHEMFNNINYDCINDKHYLIKENVKKLMEETIFPNGSIIDWKSNANGIDLNKSTPVSQSIYNIKNSITRYGYNNFNTIKNDVAGPLGVPTIDIDNFKQTIETKYIDDLLKQLNDNNTYCGFISFHGTGGYLYYEPSFSFDETVLNDKNRYIFTGINYALAKNYINNTTSNMIMPDKTIKEMTYNLIESDDLLSYDETTRALYPASLLVELSKAWGGNPLSPYGNKDAYNTTINCNKKSLASTINLMSKLKPFIDENAYFSYDEKKVRIRK